MFEVFKVHLLSRWMGLDPRSLVGPPRRSRHTCLYAHVASRIHATWRITALYNGFTCKIWSDPDVNTDFEVCGTGTCNKK